MRRAVFVVVAIACAGTGMSARAAVDRLAGSLTTVGSDTASTLLTRWATEFQTRHPHARIQVQAAGSASAPNALIEGAADLGSMSRAMTAAERGAFVARFGYAPTRFVIAHDAIAVFVHPDNPLDGVTLAQLDAIYSSTRLCGGGQAIDHWRDLGLDATRGFAGGPILPSGRDGSSGTHALFRGLALCGEPYRPQVIAWPGNGAVVATVATFPDAIGYAGAGYVNGLVKPLALAPRAGDSAVAPTPDNIASGRYPLARALYVYVNRRPQQALAALPAAFIAYMLSDTGQEMVRREGLLPLTAHERRVQRAVLDPTPPTQPPSA